MQMSYGRLAQPICRAHCEYAAVPAHGAQWTPLVAQSIPKQNLETGINAGYGSLGWVASSDAPSEDWTEAMRFCRASFSDVSACTCASSLQLYSSHSAICGRQHAAGGRLGVHPGEHYKMRLSA